MPLNLFLSHKHIDSAIAKVLGDFFRSKSGGRIRVHLSSDPNFAGPRFGRNLGAELRESLWSTNVLILLYTTADQDWSYCMWECGVATDPKTPDTSVIVLQCGSEVPAPLADTVHVNVRQLSDIISFCKQFFVDQTHPKQNEPLCPGWQENDWTEAAQGLFESLRKVLPDFDQIETFSPWPRISIELPYSDVSTIEHERSLAQQLISSKATVSGDSRAAQIFGLTTFAASRPLTAMVAQWRLQFPDRSSAWFDFCCEQVFHGIARELPIVRCHSVKECAGNAEFTPLLTHVKRNPRENKVTFEFAFFDLCDPRGTAVTKRMIPVDGMLKCILPQEGPSSIDLRETRKLMKEQHRNRLPVLSPSNLGLYVIHRSTIDEFLLDSDLPKPTLADLLQQPGKKHALESSVAFVAQSANIADAAAALSPLCSDVFVTVNGRSDEPISGWLTNADLSRNAAQTHGAAAGSDA